MNRYHRTTSPVAKPLVIAPLLLLPCIEAFAAGNTTPAPQDEPASSFWYVQGEMGYTFLSDACSEGYLTCEDGSEQLSGMIGYQISPYFALQGGYRYLGTFERSQSQSSNEALLSGMEFSAVGTYPLNDRWSLYGLAGAFVGQNQYSNSNNLDNTSANGMHVSPVVGGGVRYRINEHWQAYTGAQWAMDVAGSTTDAGILNIGIRYELPGAKPEKTVVYEPAPAVKEITQERTITHEKTLVTLPSIDLNAYFDFNKITLSPQAKNTIAQVVERLTKYPESNVRLLAFADSVGNAEVNQQVSEQRARAVADYLIAQGVDASQISIEAFGKADPSHSNATAQGRAMNRRVAMIMDAQQVQQSEKKESSPF
ncbi:OmpA-OmpF porin, OOP family [Vibrio crassostreae]|nr:OmpA-OmpF porin, OOP family [Vibrio crassostreae]CAK2276167.1 OmpA-OmpF porin, OOP family [Vibrio crassostreae]CAK2412790.1 OmpA-OmpF porin, OOP family [Vibrio crassostreae]CAK2646071.1 OmpA-OmpF porin, OOP family [Vibrio crassostreae]